MQGMRAVVNGAEILSSGVIVSNGFQPITLYPLGVPHQTYSIEIVFEEGSATEQVVINTAVVEANLKTTIKNFGSSLTFGTSTPLYVANYNNQRVLMSFVVTRVGTDINTETKLFSYTFFYGGPINAPS
jgi:hypothetical protein